VGQIYLPRRDGDLGCDFGRHTSFQVMKITATQENWMLPTCGAFGLIVTRRGGAFSLFERFAHSIYEMCERSARQNIQQASSAWTPAANRRRGRPTAGISETCSSTTTAIRSWWTRLCGLWRGTGFTGTFRPSCPSQSIEFIPEWSMYWPMLLWQQYLFSGDKTLLREMSPT